MDFARPVSTKVLKTKRPTGSAISTGSTSSTGSKSGFGLTKSASGTGTYSRTNCHLKLFISMATE